MSMRDDTHKPVERKMAKTTHVLKGRLGRPPSHAAYCPTDLQPLTVKRKREIMRIIRGEETLIGNTDAILVELLARNLAKIELMDRWLDERGLFAKDGDVQPILKIYWQALNSASRQCEQLGLSPSSRLRMGLSVASQPDLASAIHNSRGDNGNGDG